MVVDQWRGLQASATTGQEVGARLKGKQGVMVGRKRLGDDGITWPEGGNINMMHGDSRVMVVVCLETTSLPAPCLSTSTFPGSREEPYFLPFYSSLSNPPSAALLSTSSLVSFLPSFHRTVTLLNIPRCLRLILSCRINCVISLFVCVVQICASDMSLTIHGAPLGKSRALCGWNIR